MDNNCDLIKTIEDDQEVPNFSEDSDIEDDVRYKLTNYVALLQLYVVKNDVYFSYNS